MQAALLQITLPEFIGVMVFVLTCAFGLLKLNARQFTRSIEEKFAALEAQRAADREERTKVSSAVAHLEREMLRNYVRKDEHTVAITVVNAKMDEINKGQRELLLKVGVLIGKSGGT
jgi:predicted Holliday junction resolvase-like endonuclease